MKTTFARMAFCLLFLTAPVVGAFLPSPGQSAGLAPEVRAWIEEQPEEFLIDDMLFKKSEVLKGGFTGLKWPNGILYYYFDSSIVDVHRQAVRNAVGAWSRFANVSFVESSTAPSRVRIFDDGACYSQVGWGPGVRSMSLAPGCFDAITILHEFGHALGMRHEQSRSDRDSFVEILFANIDPDALSNFNIHETTNYTPYDYYSIMHYGRCAFAVNCNAGANPALRSVPVNRICTNPPEHPFSPGAPQLCDLAMGNSDFIAKSDLMDMAFHYGTTLSIDFKGRPNSFSLSVGGTVCGSDCTVAVPYEQEIEVQLVGPMSAVMIDGCRLTPTTTCVLQSQPGHRTVRAIRVVDLLASITPIVPSRAEALFSSGFE